MIKSTEREELNSSLHDRSCTEVLWEDKDIHIQIWISENYMKSGPKDNKSKSVLTVVRWHMFSWSLSGDSDSENLDKKSLEQALVKMETGSNTSHNTLAQHCTCPIHPLSCPANSGTQSSGCSGAQPCPWGAEAWQGMRDRHWHCELFRSPLL